MSFWPASKRDRAGEAPEARIRRKYTTFRRLLSLNDECLEVLAALQEDLQFVSPRQEVVETRTRAVFERATEIIASLEQLTGKSYPSLATALGEQRREVEKFFAARERQPAPRLSAWLSEVGLASAPEAGGKAAMLADVKNSLGLPVPGGYVLTTEAYRQFCGVPLWRTIREEVRSLDIHDHEALQAASVRLTELVMNRPLPRPVEIAISERAAVVGREGGSLAVRSSALGEGAGGKTFAGQYLSLLNVPPDRAVDAYRRVVASRFSERALFYRLATGLLETESPMAVLFVSMVPARASGVMYTRDPSDPKDNVIWIAATSGLAPELASGRVSGDLFVLSHGGRHRILSSQIVRKEGFWVPAEEGGLVRVEAGTREASAPTLSSAELRRLAQLGVQLEKHFKAPQDVEWVVDNEGKTWIIQTRGLALSGAARDRPVGNIEGEAVLSGGQTVYPGRVSGAAFLAESMEAVSGVPAGAVLVVRRPSAEIVEVFPRIAGLIAEGGNPVGHVAALLREFKVPSVFMLPTAFGRLKRGGPVSLDATRGSVYTGSFFPAREMETTFRERYLEGPADAVSRKVLALNLLDPAALNFRSGGCKSMHDVLRFCHEKAVQAMFTANDLESSGSGECVKLLRSALPMDLYVLDLGGGVRAKSPDAKSVTPAEIVSRPFQSLWKGFTHPGVSWTRTIPVTLSDLASVLGKAFSPLGSETRTMLDKSYLLVADEYVNMNSRLAFHFALVDACLSEIVTQNYISFRFAGGGATRWRRNLRACFIEACLRQHGFRVERRGDLVNAWLKKTPPRETDAMLDVLGRLMASTCQLDMYMTSYRAMEWYVEQFLAGNYSFRPAAGSAPKGGHS
ncbi:MAG: hypothetical protein HY822_15330 [Acidobacteria bacterium]|nr:hypothetical protein [Acidobacteriota bacterium]